MQAADLARWRRDYRLTDSGTHSQPWPRRCWGCHKDIPVGAPDAVYTPYHRFAAIEVVCATCDRAITPTPTEN
jgi:hypothetical protein